MTSSRINCFRMKLKRNQTRARVSVGPASMQHKKKIIEAKWPLCLSATPDESFLEAYLFCGVSAARYSANAVSKLVFIQGERRHSLPRQLTQNTHIRCVTGHWSGVRDDAERCRRCLVNNSPRLLPERYFPAPLSTSDIFFQNSIKPFLILWSNKYVFW